VVPFIAECAPKGNTVPHVWDCLSSRHDHTECCKRQGVIPHCLPYCKANGPVPTDMLRYGVCIGEFEKYRVCFRTYLKHHPSMLLLLLLIPSTIAQWDWTPFAGLQQQQQSAAVQQPWHRPAAFGAPQQQTVLSRTQAIYGIPGQRNANQKLRTCCRALKGADIECRRRYCDFNALRPEMVFF
ncbi:DB module, partial [Necator americanus]